MKTEVLRGYRELSRRAGEMITGALRQNPRLLLGAPTGESPAGTYQDLAEEFLRNPELFRDLQIVKIDEWGGVPEVSPGTCEEYLQERVLKPLHIPASRYLGFGSNPANPSDECRRVQRELGAIGPIDLCLLGIGMNGHLALNEPGDFLHPHCHVAELSGSTLQHSMTSEMAVRPRYGLTLGMADILKSGKIILLITGAHKRAIAAQLLSGKISSHLPASFLWLHPDVTCLIDEAAMG